jgi:hypothetical protein
MTGFTAVFATARSGEESSRKKGDGDTVSIKLNVAGL